MLFKLIAHLVVDTLNLGIGTYVLWKNPHNLLNRIFFLFVFGIVSWSIGMLSLAWVGWAWLAIFAFLSGEVVTLGFVLLAMVFPDGRTDGKKILFVISPWFILVSLTLTGFIVRGARFTSAGYLQPEYGPLLPLFGIVVGFYILFSIGVLFWKYRRASGIQRVQIRYFALGASLFLLLAFFSNVALPLFHIFQFNLLGPLFSIVFIATTAYAIVRHQFMDIRVVIQRGLLYAFSIAIISFIFFGIDMLVRRFTQESGWSDDVIATIIGAFGFVWFRHLFERATDPIFFRGGYDYAASVQKLGPLLNATIDLEALLASLDGFLMGTIKPERTIFLFDAPGNQSFFRLFLHGNRELADHETLQKKITSLSIPAFRDLFFVQTNDSEKHVEYGGFLSKMKELNIAAAIPLPSWDGEIAMLFLGKKLSDDIFRQKDIELLSVLAHQAGMAIENARLYEAERRHGEELERRVAERTQKIRSMQETQSKFLTDVSHELQTPIAILKGNAEVLVRAKRGEWKTALQTMVVTLDRMSRMTDGLLSIARLNFSKGKLHKRQIKVEDILEEAYHDCLILAENKDILLSYVSDAALVSGDRDKLKEVILNLISNGLKHTPPGGKIVLSGRVTRENVEIAVRDTGSGIDSDDLPHIFGRFYRIHSDNSSGTGLGLDICRKIIEAHGGTIVAESKLGEGSKFIVTLPTTVSYKTIKDDREA